MSRQAWCPLFGVSSKACNTERLATLLRTASTRRALTAIRNSRSPMPAWRRRNTSVVQPKSLGSWACLSAPPGVATPRDTAGIAAGCALAGNEIHRPPLAKELRLHHTSPVSHADLHGTGSRLVCVAWKKTGKKLNMGEACIRFRQLDDVKLDVIAEAFRRTPAQVYIQRCEASLASRSNADGKGARKTGQRAPTATSKAKRAIGELSDIPKSAATRLAKKKKKKKQKKKA